MGQTLSNAYYFFYEDTQQVNANNTLLIESVTEQPILEKKSDSNTNTEVPVIDTNLEQAKDSNLDESINKFVNNIIDSSIKKATEEQAIKQKQDDKPFIEEKKNEFKPTLKTIYEEIESHHTDTDDSINSPLSEEEVNLYETENFDLYNYEITEDDDSLESYPIDSKHHLECFPVSYNEIYLEDDYINDFNTNTEYNDNLVHENLVLKENLGKLQEEYDDLFFNYNRIKKNSNQNKGDKNKKLKTD